MTKRRTQLLLVAMALLSSSAAHAVDSPQEVTIGGSRRETSSPTEERIKRDDIRLIPGAFGDPYRAIEIMPGVVPMMSGLPYFYVRGAPPSAVGYFIDDVRVPYLFHFGLGPGVVQPGIVDEVSLHPAAFPARYGRYAGAVVTGQTREPTSELRGEGQIRVFDAGAYVEAPFAEGRGSAGVGGRYSYTAAIFSLFSRDTSLDYRDYNARVSYQIGDHWRATAFGFGAFDLASQVQHGVDQVVFASEFHRLDLRLDRRGDDGATSRIAMTLGLDRTRLDGRRFAKDYVVGARARHRMPVRSDLDVEVGLDATIDRFDGDPPSIYAMRPDEDSAAELALFTPRVDTATGAWASAMWHPTRRFELTGTARADVFSSDGVTEVGPSPRASMRVPIGERLTFLGAVGVAQQAPAFSIPIPAVGYRGLPGGLGYGDQKSAGAELELPFGITARAVGFHHTYAKLRDSVRSGDELYAANAVPVPIAPTQAYGVEVFVSRRLRERIGGFVSGTISRSEVGSSQVQPAHASAFDRTLVVQVGASADLGRGFRAGLRFLTYTGWPNQSGLPWSVASSSQRLPTFVRLDARFEKRWAWRKTGHVSLVIEALNATASEETIGRTCPYREPCYDKTFGPIVVPSIGVEGAL